MMTSTSGVGSVPKTIKCARCGVDVPVDKIGLPNRCPDPRCPSNAKT